MASHACDGSPNRERQRTIGNYLHCRLRLIVSRKLIHGRFPFSKVPELPKFSNEKEVAFMSPVLLVAMLGCSWLDGNSTTATGTTSQVQKDSSVVQASCAGCVNGNGCSYDNRGVCPYQRGCCENRCEAHRYISRVPRGHCEAIAESTRHAADNAADVVSSLFEWGRKIRNTVAAKHSDKCSAGDCAR